MDNKIYRQIDPRSDEDMQKYFKIAKKLSDFLKNNAYFDKDQMRWARIRLGAVEYVDLHDYINRPLPSIEDNAQEFVYICEIDGQIAGYVDFCDYHAKKNGVVIEDDIGAIHEIYVDPEFRKDHNIAYNLLMIATKKLLEKGKTKAVCSVQEDNENRFLHFAISDENTVDNGTCKRRDRSETIDYTLLIDLQKLEKMSKIEIGKKAAKLKREYLEKVNNTLN